MPLSNHQKSELLRQVLRLKTHKKAKKMPAEAVALSITL
jgi:hypothetical protein